MIAAKQTKGNGRRKKWRKVTGTYNNYFTSSWGVQTREFFQNSSLHGVKYIAETDRPFLERFMWFVCVTVGAVAATVIIFSLWVKFQTNPTITGLATDFHTWEVPFPAVILCQDEPANMTNIMDYLGYSDNSTFEEDEEKNVLFSLTQLKLENVHRFFTLYPKQNFIKSEDNMKELLFRLMNKCEDVFVSCFWKSDKYDCCNGFLPTFTESGFCYAFNSRHYFLEYKKLIPNDDKFPDEFKLMYIQETDLKWSLEFEVRNNITTRIYIIGSDDLVNIDVQPQHVWDFQANKMLFSVKETFTTQDAMQLSIKQRHCVFPKEKVLEVNDAYTYTACTTQCRMDKAMERCNCVPYFYPNSKGYAYCNITEMKTCIADFNNFNAILESSCSCQLGCINTVYEIEKLDLLSSGDIAQGSGRKYSMTTEFVSWPMVRYKREVLFGWVDLLVSFGGIAGLFLGFSLLSAVEIVYYFTIRAFCMVIREKDELIRVQREKASQPQPEYDLSFVPYFVSQPLPGRGIDEVSKRFKTRNMSRQNKILPIKGHDNWKIADTILPPFGIEFVN